ncbi:MAG: filamentous hemagglutinin N-terminal domain-containing protein [Candidatus Omnitrophota bacterium]
MQVKKLTFPIFIIFLLSIGISFLSLPSFLYALPEGEQVSAGSAAFDRSNPDTLNINTPSEKLIVNYNSFSIAQQETVNFHQPSSSSIALNRVTGIDPSSIMGTLTANGRIFLVNPNGVIFGPNSRVDVAALVASTLDISNNDFLSGNYHFYKAEGKNGYILNQGNITTRNGGYACFLSGAVENSGIIQAELGTVVLAAGERMTLALDDLGQISVVVDEAVKEVVFGPDGQKINSAIKNSGTISANGGKVILTARALNDVFDYAINNSGFIEARSLVNNNGVVELIAEGAPVINTGKIEAGEIKIEVKDSDFINKGEIITDGSPALPNGGRVSIEAGIILQQGLISANALEEGTAGEIVIVSQTSTVLDENSTTEACALGIVGNGGRILIDSTGGNTVVNRNAVIDVSAGAISGNGGFIEVSAFEQLGFYGVLSGRAPPGYQAGTAILDPTDASVSGTYSIDATVWATNNITIDGDVTIDDSYLLNLFADHNSETPGDWHDGIGTITRSGDYTISGSFATLNLKAGNGIGTSDFPIKTDVANLSAEIDPGSAGGDIYIQGIADLTITTITTPSGTVRLSASGSILDDGDNDTKITATNLILFAATGIGSGDALETQVSYLQATNSTSGDIEIINTGSLDLQDLATLGYAVKNLGTGNITIEASGDDATSIYVYAPIETTAGDISLTATNTVYISVTGADSDYEDGSSYYAQIYVYETAPITSVAGNIVLSAINSLTVTIDDAYSYIDSSSSYAEVMTYSEITTDSGRIEFTADNSLARNISSDYLDYYEDYSSNYAQIQTYESVYTTYSTVDETGKGAIIFSATNDVSNAVTVGDGDINYYYDYPYNFAYIEVSYAVAISTVAGEIELTADNTMTRDISADYIAYFYLLDSEWSSYPEVFAKIEISYTDITSTNGNITIQATNTIDNTVFASNPVDDGFGNISYEGGIDEYYDYSYNYAEVYIDNGITTISTEGDILITATNTVNPASPDKDVTADYIGYYDDESQNYAYLYINDALTTDPESSGETPGTITLQATNDVTTTVDVTNEEDSSGEIDEYDDNSENYADIDAPRDITSCQGKIELTADNDVTREVLSDYIYEFDDYSQNYADIQTSGEISATSGAIEITADNSVSRTISGGTINDDFSNNYVQISINNAISTATGNINMQADDYAISGGISSDSGDIIFANTSSGRLIALGYSSLEDDMEIDETEIGFISTTSGTITIGSETAGTITVGTADFDENDLILITGGSILDGDGGSMPDDYDIRCRNLTLNATGDIGDSGEGEEIDLDYSGTLTENKAPNPPTDLIGDPEIESWSNGTVTVSWIAATDPNYYTNSGIDGYSVVWDNISDTVPDTTKDIGDVTSMSDSSLGDANTPYFHIRAIDKAGNASDAVHIGPFYIDKTAPTVTITSPSAGTYTASQTLIYTATDSLSGIATTSPANNTVYSTSGTYNITVTVTDAAGNSKSSSVTFTIAAVTTSTTTIVMQSQLANSSVVRFSPPISQQAGQQRQFNTFDIMGPVYLYRLTTPIDSSAFDQFQLTADMYEFINGVLMLKGAGTLP